MKFIDAVFPDRSEYTVDKVVRSLSLSRLEDHGNYPVGSHYLTEQWCAALKGDRRQLEVLVDWGRAEPIGAVLYEIHHRQIDILKVTVSEEGPDCVFRYMLGNIIRQFKDQLAWTFIVSIHNADKHWQKEFELLGFCYDTSVTLGDDVYDTYSHS